MATTTPMRDWQSFYRTHPTPDPHSLSDTLIAAKKNASTATLPVKIGAANAAVLVAGIVAVAAH